MGNAVNWTVEGLTPSPCAVARFGPIPAYKIVPCPPPVWEGNNYLNGGCRGCDFRGRLDIRCSAIPCHRNGGGIAKIIKEN